jgi:hypothetical protein
MTYGSDLPSAFSPELARAVGYIVLEAADAEDSVGDLVVLRTGMEAPDPRWWRSGQALVEAVEAIGDPELRPIAELLSELLGERHNVVHGLFLEAPGARITMRRAKTKGGEPPSHEFGGGWADDCLANLANQFRFLDRMAEDAISDAMGIARGEASVLPPRKVPLVLPDRHQPRA